MNQSAIRAFGIAIFLIGALLALADRFDLNIGLPTVASSTKQDAKELQTKLHQANEEIASLKEQLKKEQPAETPATETAEQADKPTREATTMTLQIYSGITPYIVAQKLEDGGIITNSVEMELLLANAKYARSLQIGSYEINSSMSLEEIANLITGKKQ
ncbi:hypothetical protein I6G82_05055 [Lysinibacillus macroides]|uniref:Aminodeoxychorismate lyase n=1 Tax=Lysinibacillus macroides TaxID=33935 RepID=A0A0M9DIT0_9BACI|nr:hypothetical protein [Lysinibacillus macroides]KOY81473.1 hypothetical protein ADM90_16935 [Lysinibacillus macroides]QPR70311.1 hypothetical protein I6G82_05055 [Lysinibacillus macroides]